MFKLNTKNLVIISLLSSILCILSPFTINISIIPFSISTLLIMIYAIVFDIHVSFFSVLIYIILGVVGLPVFSGGTGGVQKILSPSGGFIIGYIFLCLIIAVLYNDKYNFFIKYLILLLANIIMYFIGCVHFMYMTNSNIKTAIITCVIPFIVTDNIKIILAIFMSHRIQQRIK